MLKVKWDENKCVGHSRCAAKAPRVYEVDDEGASPSNGKLVPPELEAEARLGMEACPEDALKLVPADQA